MVRGIELCRNLTQSITVVLCADIQTEREPEL